MLTQLLVWQVLWDETSLKDPQALVATCTYLRQKIAQMKCVLTCLVHFFMTPMFIARHKLLFLFYREGNWLRAEI